MGAIEVFTDELVKYNPEFADLQQRLLNIASERKKKKTPRKLLKSREIGDGKSAVYVDRATYQDALDKNFPGWSIIGETKFWTDYAEYTSETGVSQKIPILFNCTFTLQVLEKTGTPRRVTGIGSATVSEKEMGRKNTFLLKFKYNMAFTDAMKHACGWLGLFFDLRGDAQKIEDAYSPPTELQKQEFDALIAGAPEQTVKTLKAQFEQQTALSADEFIKNIRILKEKKQKEGETK